VSVTPFAIFCQVYQISSAACIPLPVAGVQSGWQTKVL